MSFTATRMDYHDHTSSAMNYYEELGVSQEATGEEIRKAHRRLVKLMHPDAQLDQSLKGLAETQMRRLNSIVSTLLDSDQRRAYDEQLYNDSMVQPHTQVSTGWRGLPWWLASIAGAVVLTLVAIWLWADHVGSSFRGSRTIVVRPVQNPPVTSEKAPTAPALTARIDDAAHDLPPTAFETEPPVMHGGDVKPPVDSHDKSSGISATVVNPTLPESGTSGSSVIEPAPAKVTQDAKTNPPLVVTPVPVPRTDFPPPPARKSNPPSLKSSANSGGAAKLKPVNNQSAAVSQIGNAPTKKVFNLPASALVAPAPTKEARSSAPIPPPPGLSSSGAMQHDESTMAMNGAPLPLAAAPRLEGGNIPPPSARTGASGKPRDPLEGEWIYAPKEPERRKAGFYPPEFIDLKLFTAGDPGNLHGQYSARYVITDKPISPEVSFQLASVDKDSRKFVWQGSNGTHGTVAIHPVDENTIRIEWRTTSNVHGPSLTSGAATLVRRQ